MGIRPSRARPPGLAGDAVVRSGDAIRGFDSAPAHLIVDTTAAELIKELNQKRSRTRLFPFVVTAAPVALALFLGAGAPGGLLLLFAAGAVVACWFAAAQDAVRRTTVILYDLRAGGGTGYEQLHDAFALVRSVAAKWHVPARSNVHDPKYHGGASASTVRQHIQATIGMPPLMKSNIEVPLLPAGAQTLAFMPDRILIFDAMGVGAVSYSDLALRVADVRFVEEGPVAADAKVVGKTWRYTNKSGGPDRRFKHNPELPSCVYEELHFTSPTGLNELFQVSRAGVGAALLEAIAGIREVEAPDHAIGPALR